MSRLVFYPNQWASGEIRGRQMAKAVGGVVDAKEIYSDDVLIFIKGFPPDKLIEHAKHVYIDVDDGWGLIDILRRRLDVTPIAASRVGQKYLQEQLGRDDVLMIPPHHCNFERDARTTDMLKVAGFIGYGENLHLNVDELRSALSCKNIQLVIKTDFSNRKDVCSFYKTIDIQISFRKPDSVINPAPQLRDVTKLINAGSFGIPIVATPEPTYVDEFDMCFLPAESIEKIAEHCGNLKSDGWLYHTMSMRALQRAEQYHIDTVSPMFKELLGRE